MYLSCISRSVWLLQSYAPEYPADVEKSRRTMLYMINFVFLSDHLAIFSRSANICFTCSKFRLKSIFASLTSFTQNVSTLLPFGVHASSIGFAWHKTRWQGHRFYPYLFRTQRLRCRIAKCRTSVLSPQSRTLKRLLCCLQSKMVFLRIKSE